MLWQAIVDFDGTISLKDTTDQILARFAKPGWEAIEDVWLAGAIGSGECMRRQIDLLHVTPAVLDDFVDQIAIDPDFTAFVARCLRAGLPIAIVSDGLDRVIRSVLRRIGLEYLPVFANALRHEGGSRWSLASPHAALTGSCSSGTCKCAIAAGSPQPLTLLVGDGRSDHCVASQADAVFAKAGLIAHCRDNSIAHHPVRGFADALPPLDALLRDEAPVGRRTEKETIDG